MLPQHRERRVRHVSAGPQHVAQQTQQEAQHVQQALEGVVFGGGRLERRQPLAMVEEAVGLLIGRR